MSKFGVLLDYSSHVYKRDVVSTLTTSGLFMSQKGFQCINYRSLDSELRPIGPTS